MRNNILDWKYEKNISCLGGSNSDRFGNFSYYYSGGNSFYKEILVKPQSVVVWLILIKIYSKIPSLDLQ